MQSETCEVKSLKTVRTFSTFHSRDYLCISAVGISFLLSVSSGYAVAQLVEALRYKPEGPGFVSQKCHCNFSLR